MSRRTTRTRKADLRSREQAEEPVEQATPPASPTARRAVAPQGAAPADAPGAQEPAEPHRRIDTDDLLALAQMDPAELAALMEGSVRLPTYEIGTQVTGRVTRVGREDIFVDLGGKSEGTIDRVELPDVSPGDEVTAFVLSLDDGVRLSTRLTGSAAAGHLDDARESGVPVEGRVNARNSGGFEVRIGPVRAFCPVSRISRLPEMDLDAYVGQTLQFRVIESGDKVVLDRRVLQEEEIAEKAEEIWRKIEPGDVHRGIVRNVQSFGVFVDIGGVDGLVPRRELGWGATDPSRLSVGQGVEVHVLEVDRERRRLTLSSKDIGDDPWNLVGDTFVAGGVYEGDVTRVEDYGAFVRLEDGLQGLAHVSRFPTGLPKVGDTVQVRILSVDHDRRRLELGPATAEELAAVGAQVDGTVAQVLKNGVVVQLSDGRSGWLPAREVELPAGTVLAQRFRAGKPVRARVLEEKGDRVTLSMRDDSSEGGGSWRQHVSRSRQESKGFGTLGDLLGGLDLSKKK